MSVSSSMQGRLVGLLLASVMTLTGCVNSGVGDEELVGPQNSEADAPAADAEAAEGTAAGEPPAFRTLFFNGTVTADATGAVSPAFCLGSGSCVLGSVFDFESGVATTAIVAEMKWEGTFDLDLGLTPRTDAPTGGLLADERYENRGGLPGSPEGHVTVRVDDPSAFGASRSWWVYVTGEAAVDVPFELRVTLFSDAPVPSEFTAFP